MLKNILDRLLVGALDGAVKEADTLVKDLKKEIVDAGKSDAPPIEVEFECVVCGKFGPCGHKKGAKT